MQNKEDKHTEAKLNVKRLASKDFTGGHDQRHVCVGRAFAFKRLAADPKNYDDSSESV